MAKSKVKKGFLHYLLFFILIVLGIFCVLVSILIFNPGEDVYGIGVRYVSHKKTIDYYKLTNSDTMLYEVNFDTINFDGDYTNFNIEYRDDENFPKIIFNPKMSALSKSEKINFEVSIELVNTTLNVSIKEPELWLGFSKTSNVTFVFPKNTKYNNYSFNVKTDSGSVGFNATKKVEVNNLSITSNTGDITIKNSVKVNGNATIITNNSRINVDSSTINNLTINNGLGKIYVNNLKGDLNITNSNTLELNCGTIGGNLFINSKKGYVKVNQLGGNLGSKSIDLETTNIDAEIVSGDASIRTSSGYVNLKQVGGKALIETESGYVNIGSIGAETDVKTEQGSITVTQKNDKSTTLHSTKGKITANFANNFENNFTAVINSENNNVVVNIPTGKAVIINYKTKSGIKASWITQNLENSGDLSVAGATSSCQKIIKAYAENGSVEINDGFVG